MTQSNSTRTTGKAPSQSVHDQVLRLRKKLERLRESDASRQDEALAVRPVRFVSALDPKRWRRSNPTEGDASLSIAGVVAAWLLYLALGTGIVALAFHVAAKH